jgi:phage gpG-like protein
MAQDNFKAARERIQRAIDAGLEAIGIVVEGQAVELAPIDSGRLKGSITYATKRGGDKPKAVKDYTPKDEDGVQHDGSENTVVIGTSVEYAVYVEFGSGPHEIVPKDKKALFWKGAKHPVKRVRHPGTPAQPFLRRSIELYKDEIKEAFSTTFKSNL